MAALYIEFYSNSELGNLAKPLEGPKIMGESYSKAEILAMALNWGSESNRAAMLNGVKKDAMGNKTPAFTKEGI